MRCVRLGILVFAAGDTMRPTRYDGSFLADKIDVQKDPENAGTVRLGAALA